MNQQRVNTIWRIIVKEISNRMEKRELDNLQKKTLAAQNSMATEGRKGEKQIFPPCA